MCIYVHVKSNYNTNQDTHLSFNKLFSLPLSSSKEAATFNVYVLRKNSCSFQINYLTLFLPSKKSLLVLFASPTGFFD